MTTTFHFHVFCADSGKLVNSWNKFRKKTSRRQCSVYTGLYRHPSFVTQGRRSDYSLSSPSPRSRTLICAAI